MIKSPSDLRFYDYTHDDFSYGIGKVFELKLWKNWELTL